MAKQFVLRSELMKRMKGIEKKAQESGDPKAVEYAVKAYNAALSTPVEKHIYCQCCGEKIREAM